jgi:hypothetical protein
MIYKRLHRNLKIERHAPHYKPRMKTRRYCLTTRTSCDFIEDERHVLLYCPFYDDFRENWFNIAKNYTVNFMSFNNEEKNMFYYQMYIWLK